LSNDEKKIDKNSRFEMKILAGDIGGTKTNLALYEVEVEERLALIEERRFVSDDYASLESLIEAFFGEREVDVQAACFGIPGPVIDDAARTTNLPWLVSETSLARFLHVDAVQLINDLEATGYGVTGLESSQLMMLNEGEPEEHGNIALIAAGTGLGQAALVWNGARYQVSASEGGHADFAPRNELEMKLLRYLLTRHKRVSYERVLSGPGLVNVYNFLKSSGYAEEPDWLREALLSSDDQAQVISQMALEEKAELCVKALEIFVTVYGAQAGNLALTFKATGGVYVGGGIAPKIAAKLADGNFLAAFKHKGRLSPMVAAVPVHVIMNPKTALLGAARYAVQQLNV
jgi:glucokinase